MDAPSIMSASSSSSADGSPRPARRKRPTSDIPTPSDPETCFYHRQDLVSGCFLPRTCQQCLQMDGCMINQFGQCVNMTIDRYNGWMDFHAGIAMGLSGPGSSNPRSNTTRQEYHFPALTAAYCEDQDPVCERCKHEAFVGEWARDTRFCVGADSCLCVAVCELPTWQSDIAGGLYCVEPLAESSSASSSSSSTPITSVAEPSAVNRKSASVLPSLYFALGALVVSIATVILDRRRTLKLFRMYHTRGIVAMASGNNRISIVAATPPLNLFGWRDHLQELIDKEQLLLAGCEDLSPVSHTIDFFIDSPSAPLEMECPQGTAPVATDAFVNASGPMLTPVGECILPSAPDFEDEIDGDDVDWYEGNFTTL